MTKENGPVADFDLAADPTLPNRAMYLDSTEISRILGREHAGAPLRRIRTKYRFGSGLRVLYRADGSTPPDTVLFSVRVRPTGSVAEAQPLAGKHGDLHPSLVPEEFIPELAAAHWRFPNDRKIVGLADLKSGSEFLADALGQRCNTDLVAYAPEKCATVRCRDEGGRVIAYVKRYATREDACRGAKVAELVQTPAAETGFRLPQVFRAIPSERLIAMEPVPGRLLATLHGKVNSHAMEAFGSALAGFHELPPPQGAPAFGRVDKVRLATAARIIGRARPDVAAMANELLDRLLESQRVWEDDPVFLHGDVHPKNALLDGTIIGFVDLDQASMGPAACDLGSFLAARIAAKATCWPFPTGVAGVKALLEGYSRRRPLPHPAELRWHTAAALLAERALRAVNRVRPNSLARLEDLLVAGRTALAGGFDA